MNENESRQSGNVKISPAVIQQYAGQEAMSCFGVVGMGAVSMVDGIVHLLKNDRAHRGVTVDMKDGRITIGLHIIVAYGVSIQAVTENLVSSVVYQVENFTGMTVDKVNVFVEGVRVVD